MKKVAIGICTALWVLGGSVPLAAQSWSFQRDRAIAPPSIAGDVTGSPRVGGFEIVCFQGEWSLYLFTPVSPSGGGGAATVIVDGQRFDTRFDLRPPAADEGLVLIPPIIEALKVGSRVEITFPTGGAPYSATFSLRGSSRALSGVDANCAYPTPVTARDRFRTVSGASTSAAITLASSLLRPILEEAHQIDGRVGIEAAGFVELDSGWQFLIANIGSSTALYGVAASAAVIVAKAPTGDWNVVAQQAGVAVYIDNLGMTNGYPDILYQSLRGVNPPYGVWTWNGREYAHSRNIPYISQ